VPDATVVIAGGGASGLSAAAALTRRGVEPVVLEEDAGIGETWARRYERLRLHTVRRFSGLAHFPIPARYPDYLSRDDVVEYLREYTRHFGLKVVTRTRVQSIRLNGDARAGWRVEVSKGEPWQARAVVMATGQYRRQVVPAWPGRDTYQGRLVHSASYVNAVPYRGQRVLVVGAGNSGAEIATDLSVRGAASVALSVRTPPPVVPRDPFGLPVQRTSIVLSALPAPVANRLGRLTARWVLGDLTRFGMPEGRFAPYSTRRVPLIDVGFVDALKEGRISVRPAVERLTPEGAIFVDGTAGAYDAIVAATGFTTGLETMIDLPGVLDDAGEPRTASGEPTAYPGLFFIGFFHSLRGHLFEVNRASRRLARRIERHLATTE
jgi:cation diffusion facilitator CzcD-associated flavoprotein CzcO